MSKDPAVAASKGKRRRERKAQAQADRLRQEEEKQDVRNRFAKVQAVITEMNSHLDILRLDKIDKHSNKNLENLDKWLKSKVARSRLQ